MTHWQDFNIRPRPDFDKILQTRALALVNFTNMCVNNRMLQVRMCGSVTAT